jgi:hypothetical protein
MVRSSDPLVYLPLFGRAVPLQSRPLCHLHCGVNYQVGDVIRRPCLPDQRGNDTAVRSIHPGAIRIAELHGSQLSLGLDWSLSLFRSCQLFPRREQRTVVLHQIEVGFDIGRLAPRPCVYYDLTRTTPFLRVQRPSTAHEGGEVRWGHVGAQMGRHPPQQPICQLGLGRPRLDRLVEDGIDVDTTAAVRYARQNAKGFELGARLFDDFLFALLELAGVKVPMQPDDLRNGVFRASFFPQG